MNRFIVDFKGIEWESPMPGVRFKAFVNDGRKLRLVEFTEELYEKDWCRKEHIGYMLDGRMTIDFAGRILEYAAGDGIFIPEGEEGRHKASIAKGERALIIFVEKA